MMLNTTACTSELPERAGENATRCPGGDRGAAATKIDELEQGLVRMR
jgi:hypothetical protein